MTGCGLRAPGDGGAFPERGQAWRGADSEPQVLSGASARCEQAPSLLGDWVRSACLKLWDRMPLPGAARWTLEMRWRSPEGKGFPGRVEQGVWTSGSLEWWEWGRCRDIVGEAWGTLFKSCNCEGHG